MIPEAEEFAVGMRPPLRKEYKALYRLLTETLGCDVDVKTIYVSFTLDGEMVAAAYPHPDRIEIAMALPEDAEGPELNDATHLTWRTMPVSINVVDQDTAHLAEPHLREAARRVGTGTHDVERPNEFFVGRPRKLREQR